MFFHRCISRHGTLTLGPLRHFRAQLPRNGLLLNEEGVSLHIDQHGFCGAELAPVAAALRESFGTEGRRMKLDFQGIVTQLAEVMYRSAAPAAVRRASRPASPCPFTPLL